MAKHKLKTGTRLRKYKDELPDVDSDKLWNPKHENDKNVKNWSKIADEHRKQDELWEQEDEGMMIRLIKIRHILWT